MTTYDGNIQATEMEGMPELYHFWAGNLEERVTSWKEDITFLGQIYLARPLKRSGFSHDASFGPVAVTIQASLMDTFIQHISTMPLEPTRVKIYRAITSDMNDYRIIFTGTLRRMGIQDRLARGEFESKARRLRVKIPKIIYQSYCNWTLFDGRCGLVQATWQIEANITVATDTLVAPIFGTYDDGYFTAGRVIAGTDERWILDHTGNTLTLQIPFDTRVSSGDTVIVTPGCDGDPDTCTDTFSNFDNYLGCPYIPSNNPVLYGFK